MKKFLFISLLAGTFLSACNTPGTPIALTEKSVVENYANIAEAVYQDSLSSAEALQTTIDSFLKTPNETTLTAAKEAWVIAREPYSQSEAFRFGNAIVDDWEGRVNAWPLDEGLIDYVDASYGSESEDNPLFTANIIANQSLLIAGKTVDVSQMSETLLRDTLHEADGVEANVSIGYHAIEFMLWGQDLNDTNAGAGQRKASDFDVANCSNANCDRRAAYLKIVTQLLVDDLSWMAKQWGKNGAARETLLAQGDQGLSAVLTGMGSLSYGELAGERIKLGLMLNDPEEEQDCFSDNTHYAHFYNIKGIENVYLGEYQRIDGTWVRGASLYNLSAKKDAALADQLKAEIKASLAAAQVVVDSAKQGIAYDQLIGANNPEGNAKVEAVVSALSKQTQSIKQVASVLKVNDLAVLGSDSLDSPDAVFE